ncbi:MAG: hypothetical protein HY656_03675 [Acidobacteria bacterium]|nr:hypothetical protein [Acidobacteriota bacterium]
MRQFPAAGVNRLNEMVKAVRRRQGWGDISAVVDPPLRPEHPPVLRLEKSGTTLCVPIDVRAVEQAMRTGQESPLLVEIKQGFLRILKAAERREKVFRPAGPPRKGRSF